MCGLALVARPGAKSWRVAASAEYINEYFNSCDFSDQPHVQQSRPVFVSERPKWEGKKGVLWSGLCTFRTVLQFIYRVVRAGLHLRYY